MAKIYNNGIATATGLNISAPTPADDRFVVAFISDLAALSNKYDGLITKVQEDGKTYTYNLPTNTWSELGSSVAGNYVPLSGTTAPVTGSVVFDNGNGSNLTIYNDDYWYIEGTDLEGTVKLGIKGNGSATFDDITINNQDGTNLENQGITSRVEYQNNGEDRKVYTQTGWVIDRINSVVVGAGFVPYEGATQSVNLNDKYISSQTSQNEILWQLSNQEIGGNLQIGYGERTATRLNQYGFSNSNVYPNSNSPFQQSILFPKVAGQFYFPLNINEKVADVEGQVILSLTDVTNYDSKTLNQITVGALSIAVDESFNPVAYIDDNGEIGGRRLIINSDIMPEVGQTAELLGIYNGLIDEDNPETLNPANRSLYVTKDSSGRMSVSNRGGGAIATNTAFGEGALISNVSGINNTALGVRALTNATGSRNVAIGPDALRNTTGNNNVGAGVNAMFANGAGQRNVAIGSQALLRSISGDGSTVIGYQAMASNLNSVFNTVLGHSLMMNSTAGQYNTWVGFTPNTLFDVNVTTGNGNTILGGSVVLNTEESAASRQVIIADGYGERVLFKNAAGDVNIRGNSLTFNGQPIGVTAATPTLQSVLEAGSIASVFNTIAKIQVSNSVSTNVFQVTAEGTQIYANNGQSFSVDNNGITLSPGNGPLALYGGLGGINLFGSDSAPNIRAYGAINYTQDFTSVMGDLSLIHKGFVTDNYVPYSGATKNVDLGVHTLTSGQHFFYDGTGSTSSITAIPGSFILKNGSAAIFNYSNLTADRVYKLPNANGTFPVSVNGFTPDANGNIVLPMSSGSTTAVWGMITGTLSSQSDLQAALNAKQDVLVSGTSIKTLNGQSLLGSGNITISAGTAATWGTITGTLSAQTDLQTVLNTKIQQGSDSTTTIRNISTVAAVPGTPIANTIYLTPEVASFQGSASITGNGTTIINIPHTLGLVPSYVNAQAKNAAAAGISFVSATSTNIVITYSVAPASGASLQFYLMYSA